MTFHELIDELHRRHIRIHVQEENLHIDAPKGALTETLTTSSRRAGVHAESDHKNFSVGLDLFVNTP